MRGYVVINWDKQMSQSNLIVYQGREVITPFLLKVDNTQIEPRINWGLYYWALGSGGVLDPGDPSTRILVSPTDTQLGQIVDGFDPSVPGTTPNGRYRKIENITFLQDNTNGDRFLITVLSLRIDKEEFVDIPISEAGLFLSNSPEPNLATKFVLFARTTFPAVLKQNTFSMSFTWYIYS